MPNTTTSQVPAAVSSFYDRNLLERAVPNFIHLRFAQFRDLPKNNSDTIKFRKYANLAAATTPLSEGVTPAGSQLSVTDITAQVRQYGDFVTLTDFLLMTTLDPILMETSDILGDQAGNTLDILTRDTLSGGTTIQYASTATGRGDVTAAMKLNLAEVKEMVRTLKNNIAPKITDFVDPTDGVSTKPINRAYVGFLHPNVTFDLKGDSDFLEVQEYSQPADRMPDEVGAIDEVRFLESTNAKVFAGQGNGGADVYSTVIVGKNAYGASRITGEALHMIVKQLGSGEDPLNQRATSGWKATFVAKRLQETWMGRIEHGATAS